MEKTATCLNSKEDPVGCMGGVEWESGWWKRSWRLGMHGSGKDCLSFSKRMRHIIGMWTAAVEWAVQGTWPDACYFSCGGKETVPENSVA